MRVLTRVRSARPQWENITLTLSVCPLVSQVIRETLWLSLIGSYDKNVVKTEGSTQFHTDTFKLRCNPLKLYYFRILPYDFPLDFLEFFVPLLISSVISYFYRVTDVEKLMDDVSKSTVPIPPGEIATLVGWAFHSTLRVLHSQLGRASLHERQEAIKGAIFLARQFLESRASTSQPTTLGEGEE